MKLQGIFYFCPMEGIGTLIIILLVVVIILGFRKSLALIIVKWTYGEYSKKYVVKFKKRTRKQPHPYCFKDDFYYHILSIPKAINCDIHYKTNKVFDFDHLNFNKNFKQNLRENGKPDCFTLSEDQGVDLKVAGYKSSVFHSNEKTLLYHCKGDYFMGEYVFSSLADDTPELLIGLLKEQFHPDIKHSKNFTISDSQDNYVYFTDTGFFLSLKFFNKNHTFINKMQQRFGKDAGSIPLEGLGKAICD